MCCSTFALSSPVHMFANNMFVVGVNTFAYSSALPYRVWFLCRTVFTSSNPASRSCASKYAGLDHAASSPGSWSFNNALQISSYEG